MPTANGVRPLFVAAFTASVAIAPRLASACPDQGTTEVTTDSAPATNSPCVHNVDFSRVRRVVEVGYSAGAGGQSQTGVGQAALTFAGLDLGYALQFGGDDEQPSYELEVNGGVSAQRLDGDVSTTGLVTQASARIGPAQVTESVVDEGRANFAFFPLTMELAHTGEMGALPRLGARPELARSPFDRERVALATRLIRVEGAGEKASTAAPGVTPVKKPTSWAFDFITLHGDLDVAKQSATRLETGIGGALLGVTEHTTNASLDVFGIEHRRIDLPMTGATNLDVLWMLRLAAVNPQTGSQYYMGWGAVIDMPDRNELASRLDPEGGDISIGGLGWFTQRAWGGFGAQYKREPFVTMAGQVALEDRVSGEVFVPRPLPIVARAFAARATRLVDNELQRDATAGVQLDASYARGGFVSRLGLELGRTFYTALDDTMPQSTGFAASAGLTIQHSGRRAWTR